MNVVAEERAFVLTVFSSKLTAPIGKATAAICLDLCHQSSTLPRWILFASLNRHASWSVNIQTSSDAHIAHRMKSTGYNYKALQQRLRSPVDAWEATFPTPLTATYGRLLVAWPTTWRAKTVPQLGVCSRFQGSSRTTEAPLEKNPSSCVPPSALDNQDGRVLQRKKELEAVVENTGAVLVLPAVGNSQSVTLSSAEEADEHSPSMTPPSAEQIHNRHFDDISRKVRPKYDPS